MVLVEKSSSLLLMVDLKHQVPQQAKISMEEYQRESSHGSEAPQWSPSTDQVLIG